MAGKLARFHGTGGYIASDELQNSVNIAIALGRPLLVKGEPGTGKTMLAKSIAENLGMDLIIWNIKSTTKAQEGLYVYDTVQRLYDSQFGDRDVSDIKQYIKLGKLGEAFISEKQVVLLIDEIDKADLEFPNDLLWELDIMSFYIPETGETMQEVIRFLGIKNEDYFDTIDYYAVKTCVFYRKAREMSYQLDDTLPELFDQDVPYSFNIERELQETLEAARSIVKNANLNPFLNILLKALIAYTAKEALLNREISDITWEGLNIGWDYKNAL